jgi:two-component system, OmpR family, response regulator
MAIRLLLIDDDTRLFALLADYLGKNGVELAHAGTGEEGLRRLQRDPFDGVLLDVMMPGIDGLEVCRRLRQRDAALPIIMLTAKGDETDRVVGLELGADDYLPKPFSPRELLARVRAVLRRTGPTAPVGGKLRAGGIQLEPDTRRVWVDGREVTLTGLEFDLLAALVRRAGRVVPRESLLAQAGRDDVFVGERTIDVHISHLRQKLGDDPRQPRLIKTVRGVGYLLAGDEG